MPFRRNDVVISNDIPESVLELATAKRTELIEQLAEVDDIIGEIILNDESPNNVDIAAAIRRSTVGLKFSPVFLGSAIKNTAIQPLLDGVCQYLPDPSESEVRAHDTSLPTIAPQVRLSPAAEAPMVGLAFKLEEGRFGQLTYMRMYQGSLKKGMQIFNARTGKKVKVPRLVRMHSNEMEASISRLAILMAKLTRIANRILNPLALEKFALFLVWSVHRVIPSRMDRQAFQW
jgi:elongation factor G